MVFFPHFRGVPPFSGMAMVARSTEATFFGLTIYAWTTKSDVTGFGMYLFAALLVARLALGLKNGPGDPGVD